MTCGVLTFAVLVSCVVEINFKTHWWGTGIIRHVREVVKTYVNPTGALSSSKVTLLWCHSPSPDLRNKQQQSVTTPHNSGWKIRSSFHVNFAHADTGEASQITQLTYLGLKKLIDIAKFPETIDCNDNKSILEFY